MRNVLFRLSSASQNRACLSSLIESLSTRVFETRTATGSELFSLLTCLHTTAFALPSIFSPLEMLGTNIWETPLSWHSKCLLPVVVRVSKMFVLKLPNSRSGKTPKCGKNISDTLGHASCATFLSLPHFDVICDRLLNRRTVTWNLFVKWMHAGGC